MALRLIAAGVLGFLGWAPHAASPAAGDSATASPAELEACVERWNWMNYRHWFGYSVAPARVQAAPCRVEIAYALPRTDRLHRLYLRSTYFPCLVNRFGAFVCPEHAAGRPNGPRRFGHNARFFPRNGRIELDTPPARAVTVRKPDWVRRYPVVAGFIVPFDSRGRLRSGLVLRRRPDGNPTNTTCTTFADIHNRSRLYGCGAGSYCFARSLPPRDRQPLACPEDRGSRTFDRGVLRVMP
jgi:hypothetical protein